MRELEAAAFETGTSEPELQVRAALAVAEEVARLASVGARVAVVVGHGNNGRDGGLAAEWLAKRGRRVEVVVAPRHGMTAEELSRLRGHGAVLIAAEDHQAVREALRQAVVAVDAIAGIGVRGALREPLAGLVGLLNAHAAGTVLAVDVPSGIDADTGEVPGEAVDADITVTLGAVKQGLLRFPAAQRTGRLLTREIGVPEGPSPYEVLEPHAPPARPLDAHKYTFGRVLVLAGSDHFLGAPVLCAGGALRVGAGLVTVGSTRDVRLTVAARLPEATYTMQDVNVDVTPLASYLETHQAVVIGPGLGRGPRQTRFVLDVLRGREQGRVVIDADGLVALAETPEWWTLLPRETVLTPHAGELARLLGSQLPNEPAWETAGRLAAQWGCVLVYKGPFTCVAEPSGRVRVWPRANPLLSTGGTGDVLAGITGGLLAQGCSAPEAAASGVAIHALAAQALADKQATLLASDLFDEVPRVLKRLTQPE